MELIVKDYRFVFLCDSGLKAISHSLSHASSFERSF